MKDLMRRKSVVTIVFVSLVGTLGAVAGSSEAVAQHSKRYQGITSPVFDSCIRPKRSNAASKGWAEYDAGNQGEVRLKSTVPLFTEPAELSFAFNPNKNTLDYTIKRKSFGVTESKIWEGFDGTMNKCKK
jgi:hypothetical protein